jgi:Tfp pilus assembly protein PilF
MSLQRRWFGSVFCVVIAVTACAGGAIAAGSGSKETSTETTMDAASQLYEQGLKEVEKQDFDAAFELFERANKSRKNDADILNMLGFTQRKLGRLNEAFKSYAKALDIQPEFPQAREYLAEAHLQAAMEQMRLLRETGAPAQAEVAQLLDAFAKAAWTVGAGARSAPGDSTRRW